MKTLATRQIRVDHAHVTTLFRRFTPGMDTTTKQGLVRNICAALEIHAQLEEEIFYPALRDAGIDSDIVAKSVPEHDEMRRLIGELRNMQPSDPAYDKTFMELMRDVIHHMADEETTLLPDAERQLADRLGEIGKRMARRRMELSASMAGEIADSFRQATPMSGKLLAGGALLAGSLMVGRALYRSRNGHGLRLR
jgi:hemerythrin superfamily protein